MDNQSKLVISKLNQETVEGKIGWNKVSRNIILPFDGELYGCIYEGKYKGKNFQIYKYVYNAFDIYGDFQYKTSDVRLEIIDYSNRIEWEFESDNSIVDLYENVRLQALKINDLFNEILSD